MSIRFNNPPSTIRFDDGTREIVLRLCELSHVDPLLEAFAESVNELRQFMPWAHMEQTVEVQTERLSKLVDERGTQGNLVYHFYDGENGPFLGCIGAHQARLLNPKGFEIGYWCRSGRAGEGWTTLAARCLVVLGLDYFGFERIQCAYNEANIGSCSVVRKVGFHEEARLRNFESQPTEAQRAAGSLVQPYCVMCALFPEDRAQLAWYPTIASGLQVYDADGVQVAQPE